MTKDMTAEIELDNGGFVPSKLYAVQNNRSEFFQKILWSSITKCIIYIAKGMRTKNICDCEECAVFPVKSVKGSKRMLLLVGQEQDDSDIYNMLTTPRDATIMFTATILQLIFKRMVGEKLLALAQGFCPNISQSGYTSSNYLFQTVLRFY